MRLEMFNRSGRAFYVFKPWSGRSADPDALRAAKSLEHGRVYTTASLRRLEANGAILRAPFAPEFVLVAKDAPSEAGGREQGFWKLLQKRLRIKHASCAVDKVVLPALKDVEAWLARQPSGPQPDALPSLFPTSDELGGASPTPSRGSTPSLLPEGYVVPDIHIVPEDPAPQPQPQPDEAEPQPQAPVAVVPSIVITVTAPDGESPSSTGAAAGGGGGRAAGGLEVPSAFELYPASPELCELLSASSSPALSGAESPMMEPLPEEKAGISSDEYYADMLLRDPCYL
eukprot:m51a1_g2554 hypothetical protein (286) ;mRNA; r:320694-321551